MSCSKPLSPFVCDSLYYLNRNQLERFSIVCRPLKSFIARYLHSKPYRVFGCLDIRGGSYALRHNAMHWHPNRNNYSVQQFLAGQRRTGEYNAYYSFALMRPYLDQTVRIEKTFIYLDIGNTYNYTHIEEMESIAHLWCNGKISVFNGFNRILADDFQLILNSPTILQCQLLCMRKAHFSFKDHQVLYSAKILENYYGGNKTDPNYWMQFLEQSGAKPLVVLTELHRQSIDTILDHLSKAFSSAISRNAFKIVFADYHMDLTEFRKTNETSGEKLELKKGLPTEYQNEDLDVSYTLERSSI